MKAAAAALLLLAGAAAHGQTLCPDDTITVASDDPALGARICEVAGAAAKRLAQCGLPLPGPLQIATVQRLPPACVGVFHCGEGRIEVLDPAGLATVRQADSAFAAISDQSYFDSIVAHEIAHAAYEAVPCPFGTCEVTSEYVAYATQIDALPAEERAAFLAAADAGQAGDAVRADLTLVRLKLAPDRFALTAIRHLAARPDPCGYLAAIARGDILFDRERP